MSSEDPYVRHRSLLFTVAYEMLGSAGDAEDVVQDTWLRWHDVDRSQVRDPRAYLVRITTRLALNRMRSVARRREEYVGPWLPEPLLTTGDVADDVELADSISTAMLVILETMAPVERAVFILREVFALPYAEIAQAVDKTPDAVRQIAHRARGHVEARRPRHHVNVAEHRRVTDLFMRAIVGADLQPLMDVLAPDVVLITDGGGVKKAALRPIVGVEKVLRFIAGVLPSDTEIHAEQITLNGQPAIAFFELGKVDTVVTVRIDAGLVSELYLVRNPAKLDRVGRHTEVTR